MLTVGCAAAAIFAAAALWIGCETPGDTGPSRSMESVAQTSVRQPLARLVKGDLKSLVIQRDELPGEFSIVGGEPKGANEFAQVYFNPEALLATGAADPGLLGVIVDLMILEDGKSAQARFTTQGGLDPSAVLQDIRSSTPGAIPRRAEPYAVSLPNTDRILAFHVHYVLQGTDVYEYRFRIIVGNAIANLIISARALGDGSESASLEKHARLIVERQVARLIAACG